MSIDVSMFDYVDFVDVVDTDQKIGTWEDTIALSDSISSHRFTESFDDLIRYQDRMEYNASLVRTMTDTLPFSESIYWRQGHMTDLLQFFDVFSGNNHVLSDSLVFIETLTGNVGVALSDELGFSDSIQYDSVLHRTTADSLNFIGSISGFRFSYTIPVSPLPPPPNNVTLVSTIGLGSVTLHAPKFGDSSTTNFKRVNKTSRGDDIIISGEPNWFPTFLHKLEFEYLSEEKCTKLRDFLRKHVGIPVNVTSHYGETWKVIFLRPEVEFSQVGRENRTLTLDMQIVQ